MKLRTGALALAVGALPLVPQPASADEIIGDDANHFVTITSASGNESTCQV